MSASEKRSLISGKAAPEEAEGAGVVAAFIQLLQGNLGPGILTLPFIFTIGGVVITSLMTLCVTLATLYAMYLVLRCKQWLHRSEDFISVPERDRPQTFQDIGRELLGKTGEKIIIVFVVLMQLGICTVFFNYAAENIIAVERFYVSHENGTCLAPGVPGEPDRTTQAPGMNMNMNMNMVPAASGGPSDWLYSSSSSLDASSAAPSISEGVSNLYSHLLAAPGDNETSCNNITVPLTKQQLVIVMAPVGLALSLGRSSMLITICTTAATLIMYVGLGTILFLVGWHFKGPKDSTSGSFDEFGTYFGGDGGGGGGSSFDEGVWGPISDLMSGKNSTRWSHVQVWPEHPEDIPIVFGNLVYTVTTAVGILLPIENSMRLSVRPRFMNVVFGAILCALFLFLMVGILSNLAFGKQTETSITAQFVEHNIGDATYISVVNIFLSISVILTYPLQFRPAAAVIEKSFGILATLPGAAISSKGTSLQARVDHITTWQRWGYIPVRIFLVTMTATLAAVVPQLDLVVSLAGSFTSSVLAMMVPPAMDFAVMRREQKYSAFRVVCNCILIFFGMIGLIAGTGATLLEILGIPLPGIPSDRHNKTVTAADEWYDALPKVHPIMY